MTQTPSDSNPSTRASRFWLLLILSIAAVLRLLQPDVYVMWIDELSIHHDAVTFARFGGEWPLIGNISTWGPLALRQEGLLAAILIASRFTCIITIGVVLLGTTPLLTNIKAMRALGLPQIMADMALLTFRYLQEIGRDLRNMQTSMRLRGFNNRRLSLKGLRVLAWLSGSLLVYSYEHSESVYQAMILRGYGHAPPRREFCHNTRDTRVLIAIAIITAGIIVGDMVLGHNTAALLKW